MRGRPEQDADPAVKPDRKACVRPGAVASHGAACAGRADRDLEAVLDELLADPDPEVRADAEELIEIWYSK
jgi:hypothetical protein